MRPDINEYLELTETLDKLENTYLPPPHKHEGISITLIELYYSVNALKNEGRRILDITYSGPQVPATAFLEHYGSTNARNLATLHRPLIDSDRDRERLDTLERENARLYAEFDAIIKRLHSVNEEITVLRGFAKGYYYIDSVGTMCTKETWKTDDK